MYYNDTSSGRIDKDKFPEEITKDKKDSRALYYTEEMKEKRRFLDRLDDFLDKQDFRTGLYGNSFLKDFNKFMKVFVKKGSS